METFGKVVWFVLRVVILLVLFGTVVGTGVCSVALYQYGAQSQTPDNGVLMLVAGLSVATVILAWVFWIVLRALFLKKPKDVES